MNRALPMLTRLAAITSLVAACGDTVTIIECDLGTVAIGAECVPIGDADTTAPTDTADSEPTTAPDSVVTDTHASDSGSTDTASDDTHPPADTTPAPQGTGAACAKHADCLGGTCLDWRGGYCSTLDCDDANETGAACPEGAACASFAANAICLARCGAEVACRPEEQACKTLLSGGALLDACVGLEPGALGTGAACDDATDCAGTAACLSAFPGGYCANLGCEAGTCPSDARCVRVDRIPSCLLRCETDADCGDAPGAERRCGTLETVGGQEVSVCISGVAGRDLGEGCVSDFECTSGTCNILGEGECSQSGEPCFPDTADRDCGVSQFCRVTGESRTGICGRPCREGGEICQGGAFCLAEGPGVTTGQCRKGCTPGQADCPTDLGLACRFGVPLSGGQGRYVCSRLAPGAVGAPCESGQQCASGSCLAGGSGTGFCTAPCQGAGVCTFPGSCVFVDADTTCQPACQTSDDCPAGTRCEFVSGSARDVCTPIP